MRSEIARLQGEYTCCKKEQFAFNVCSASINLAKSNTTSYGNTTSYRRTNSYVNPNYQPRGNKHVRPTAPALQPGSSRPPTTNVKDVVLGGVAFESSSRSLVRKDRKFAPFYQSLLTSSFQCQNPRSQHLRKLHILIANMLPLNESTSRNHPAGEGVEVI